MKGNTSKSGNFKKQVKRLPLEEKYQIKNRSNVLAIFMACLIILIMIIWIITGFGLGISYFLLKNGHYVWASLIILLDILLIRSYIKSAQ